MAKFMGVRICDDISGLVYNIRMYRSGEDASSLLNTYIQVSVSNRAVNVKNFFIKGLIAHINTRCVAADEAYQAATR